MSTRKQAIKQALIDRGETDLENEMIQADVLMDAEHISKDKYDLTETAIIDIKEVYSEIESEREDTAPPDTDSE